MVDPIVTLPEPKTQFHRVFDAVSNRLRTVFPERLFDLQMMSATPSRDEWLKVTRRKPCIAISWVDFKPAAASQRLLKGDASFTVYLVVDNAEISRRFLGDARGVGLFGMLTAASYLLHGFTIDDVGTIKVTGANAIERADWIDETTEIAGLTTSIPMSVGDGIASATLEDFLRLGASWMANGADAGFGTISME
jgi:hypothetical protein